jgi:carboxypeptidase C (cathepsin A)
MNRKAFGVSENVHFVDDNQQMYNDFSADISTSYKRSLERILSLRLKVLIYNGQNDFIVNTAGVLTYLNTLEWPLSKQWRNTKKKNWEEYGEDNLGWFKEYGNLNFVQIRNAGHLVPSDQPRIAWKMAQNYFYKGWYDL